MGYMVAARARTERRRRAPRRLALAGMVVFGLFLLLPTSAFASSLRIVGSTIRYEANPGEANNLEFVRSGSNIFFVENAGIPITATGPCGNLANNVAGCPAAGVTGVVVDVGDVNDAVVVDNALDLPYTIYGGSGEDFIEGGPQGGTIDGGEGFDEIVLGSGTNTVSGGSEADLIVGGDGADVIDGGGGNDEIVGLAGDDRISGGLGSDLILGSGGDDQIDGGPGSDCVDGGATLCAQFFTAEQPSSGTAAFRAVVRHSRAAHKSPAHARSFLSSIRRQRSIATSVDDGDDQVNGGDGSDLVTGGDGSNVLSGGAGDDTVLFFGAADEADGGDGSDVVAGIEGPGAEMTGGAGDDLLFGGDGPNTIDGGPGNDVVSGGGSKDKLRGGDGNDVLIGFGGDDQLSGGDGGDTLRGDDGNDKLDGGEGADEMRGGPGEDFADYSFRSAALTVTIDNLANDGEANERDNVRADVEDVNGGSGDDTITGSNGANALYGKDGNDTIKGDASTTVGGNDSIDGGGDDDTLDGGPGNDSVVGDYGSDKVGGGIGNDRLAGGPGTDVFAGGVGTDTVTYEGEDASTISIDGIANDGPAGDKDNVAADVENVIGSAAGDTIVGSAAANVLDGAGGDDNIKGGSGNDSLIGGAGDDTLSDISGLNTLDYRSAPGGITVSLAGPAPQVIGAAGSDTLVGPLGTWATIFGSEFADTFDIHDTKKETLDGRGGTDNLTGKDAVDVVVNVP